MSYIIYHISLLHPRWDEQCRDTMMTVPPQLTSSLPSFSYPASFRHPPPASSESMSELTLSWCDWSFLTRTYSDPLSRSETFCNAKVLPGRPHWLCLGWLGLVHWLSAAQRSEKPWLQHLARVGETKDRLQPEICFGVAFVIVRCCFLLEFLEHQV